MIGTFSGFPAPSANLFAPTRPGESDPLAKMREAVDRLERSQFDSQLYGRQLRQAANEASARAIKLLAELGTDTRTLARMADQLAERIFRDVATQGPDAIHVPQSYVAAGRYSFSLEIERLSFTAGSDGSFSFSYQKISVSVVAESYVAGLGADDTQAARFFTGGPGASLLLPERGERAPGAKPEYRLLVPVDPTRALWGWRA
jgi:hypothetical protein